jgi:hypothetical protein
MQDRELSPALRIVPPKISYDNSPQPLCSDVLAIARDFRAAETDIPTLLHQTNDDDDEDNNGDVNENDNIVAGPETPVPATPPPITTIPTAGIIPPERWYCRLIIFE